VYLSRLKLNPLSREVVRDIADVSHLHRTVMRAFPKAPADENPRALYKVLYRLEMSYRTGMVALYVQSRVQPAWDALPDGYVVENGVPEIDVKRVDHLYERIEQGRRLRFRLRANPTRKIDTKTREEGGRRHGRRVPVRGEQAQCEWLQRKGKQHGFAVVKVGITSSGAAQLSRSLSTERTFQGVVFDGILVVTDSDRFKQALVDGIGPGKAFGFGLMSVAAE